MGRYVFEVHPSCGYILKSLFPEAMCPECGHAVTDSLKGGLLRFADPRWLKAVWGGLVLLWVYGVALLICGVAGWLAAVLMQQPLFVLLWIVPPLILTVAVGRLTRREQGRLEWRPGRAARLARVGSWGSLIVVVGLMLVGAFMVYRAMWAGVPTGDFGGLAAGVGGLDLLRLVMQTLGFVGLMGCLAALARRIPHLGLARQSKVLAWGFGVSGVIGFGGRLLYLVGMVVMLQAFGSTGLGMTHLAGTPLTTVPARPAGAPAVSGRFGQQQSETWTHLYPDGTEATLTIETDQGSGEQTWTEEVTDPTGMHLATHSLAVDAQGAASYIWGHGPTHRLHFIGLQVAEGTGQVTGPGAPVAGLSGVGTQAVPALPSRPADSVRQVGSGTISTWNDMQPNGAVDTFTEQINADGSREVTQMQTDASGNVTTTVIEVDASGVVTHSSVSQVNMPTGTFGAGMGNMVVAGVLSMAGGIGMLIGWLGFVMFLVWLSVLVFYFRRHLAEARMDAGALYRAGHPAEHGGGQARPG